MAILNMSEPLGLPHGTVRAVIALAFTFVSLYLFATGQAVPESLLAVNTLIIGNYFGSRGVTNEGDGPEEALAPPYVAGDPA